MARAAKDPFGITFTDEQRTTLALWLTAELNNAIAAKSSLDLEVDYWHAIYEQARTRPPDGLPWPDAADLTSYIGADKVDSLHARIMKAMWTDPIWTVEGWGPSASQAPFVEEFHQWKAQEEELHAVLDQWLLMALIEPRGLLEVYESGQRRVTRKTITAKPKMTEDGGMVFGEDGKPQLQQKPDGTYVEASADEPGVSMVVDSSDVIRTGPDYRVIPYRDSLVLPGHARDKQEIWGYAKRIWPQLGYLRQQAKAGIYDQAAVDQLTDTGDRDEDANRRALLRSQMAVAPQQVESAEKELWEGLILVDLNNLLDSYGRDPVRGVKDGKRWYLVTIHLRSHTLLRWVHDDFERSRFIPLILFPRPDRAGEGFSLIGHKLITTIEEHSAYRNMGADATSRAVNKPILKLQGALWDEDEQPFGPKAVITVRSPQEITEAEVSDVPQSIEVGIERAERTSDRLSGINDVASGQTIKGDKTLGEIQMATEQSFVRMDLVVHRAQDASAKLAQIRHAIWKRTLAEQPDGIDAPESVIIGLEGRGVPIDQYMPNGKITAAMLDGSFRFKPYGSVESADINRDRNNLVGLMQALAIAKQQFPLLGPMFATPQAARAIGRQILRVFRVPNQQAFLGSPSQDFQQQQQLNALPPAPAIPPPPPQMGPSGVPGQGPAPGQGVMPPPLMPSPLAPMPGMVQ